MRNKEKDIDEIMNSLGHGLARNREKSMKGSRVKSRKVKQACGIVACIIFLFVGIKMLGFEPTKVNEGLPEGYVKVSEKNIDAGVETVYADNDGENVVRINSMDSSKNSNIADIALSSDFLYSKIENCYVGKTPANFFGGGKVHLLTWEVDGILWSIESTLDKETMIQIGEWIAK